MDRLAVLDLCRKLFAIWEMTHPRANRREIPVPPVWPGCGHEAVTIEAAAPVRPD